MKSLVFTKFDELSYTLKEQFMSLNVNLEFCGDDVKLISVTSCVENEGKSYLAMQLMRASAMSGKRVLLIDADLRNSQLVRDYGVESAHELVGLSHFLEGKAEVKDIIYSTNIPNAHFMPAGKVVPNPITLFKKQQFDNLLGVLREHYDLVIMDTPPVEPIIDGVMLAAKCDGTVLVVNYGRISLYEVQDVKNQLLSAGVTILGAVLNRVPFNAGNYYYKSKYYGKNKYYPRYGYGYGIESQRQYINPPAVNGVSAMAGRNDRYGKRGYNYEQNDE